MPTLLVSTWSLPGVRALGDAARKLGWRLYALDEIPSPATSGQVVFYGGSDVALEVASRFHLALIEPPLDLLALLPLAFRHRAVEYSKFRELRRLKSHTFVKPADALNKVFDAGTYSDARDIRAPRGIDPETPVLVAGPVQWLAEYRCFILEGKVAASSPYLSFGRPVWRPYAEGGEASKPSANVLTFCERLLSHPQVAFPPAFVVDVGLIEDLGWAVVEFNPVWCSGLLGADPRQVLPVLRRACLTADNVSDADRQWVIQRTRQGP
jgi:hypothetical protein